MGFRDLFQTASIFNFVLEIAIGTTKNKIVRQKRIKVSAVGCFFLFTDAAPVDLSQAQSNQKLQWLLPVRAYQLPNLRNEQHES